MAIVLPLFFLMAGRWIAPHAPGAGFSLLVMAGFIAAYISDTLGAHYLIGAFIVGLIARLMRSRVPHLTAGENLRALRLFSSFFVPFYFFNVGVHAEPETLSLTAFGIGLALTVTILPLRMAIDWVERRMGNATGSSVRESIALMPTLIFTMVLAQDLHIHFGISHELYGGLMAYAVISTALPSLIFKSPFTPDPALEAPAEKT
jgi:Kef-type K+ transport system membrane component KefB